MKYFLNALFLWAVFIFLYSSRHFNASIVLSLFERTYTKSIYSHLLLFYIDTSEPTKQT